MSNRDILYKYYSFIEKCFDVDKKEKVLEELKESIENLKNSSIYHILLRLVLKNKGDPKKIDISPISVEISELSRGDFFVNLISRIHWKDQFESGIKNPVTYDRLFIFDSTGWAIVEGPKDSFSKLEIGKDYEFNHLKSVKNNQKGVNTVHFSVNSSFSQTEEVKKSLDKFDFNSFIKFHSIKELSLSDPLVNLRNMRIISKEERSFKKTGKTKSFIKYSLVDSSGTVELLDWGSRMDLLKGDMVSFYLLKSQYYEPRETFTLTLTNRSNWVLEKQIQDSEDSLLNIYRLIELNNLFLQDRGVEIPNFVEVFGRVVSILKVDFLASRGKDPLDSWRIQLLIDDSTAVVKTFVSLRHLSPILDSGLDYSSLIEAGKENLLRVHVQESLKLKPIKILGRVNRFNFTPQYSSQEKVYTSIFAEEPVQLKYFELSKELEQ